MDDIVFIEKLALRGKHGVSEEERAVEQEFLIDIRAHFDTSAAERSDRIEDTLNYSEFRRIAQEVVEGESFYLIERLAGEIADRILMDQRVRRVEITVRKPSIYPDAIPGVAISRSR